VLENSDCKGCLFVCTCVKYILRFSADDGKIRRFACRNGGKHGTEIVKDREVT